MRRIFDEYPESPIYCIIVDCHEHKIIELIKSRPELCRLDKILWICGRLELTDFCIADIIDCMIVPRIFIERKTFDDVVATLLSKDRRFTLEEIVSTRHTTGSVMFILESFQNKLAQLDVDSDGKLFLRPDKRNQKFTKSTVHASSVFGYINSMIKRVSSTLTLSPEHTVTTIVAMLFKRPRLREDQVIRHQPCYTLCKESMSLRPYDADGTPMSRILEVPCSFKKGKARSAVVPVFTITLESQMKTINTNIIL